MARRFFFVLLSIAWPALLCTSQDIPYTIGSWSDTLGNHRARIQVSEQADAVWIHLPWRRHDRDLQEKQILIIDAATGQSIANVVRIQISGESADLVFQPHTVPGEYFVHDSLYEVQQRYGNYDGKYLSPQTTALPEWVQQHGLMEMQLPQGEWKKLPQAKILEFQSRSEFERFDPMEVVATSEEMSRLLEDNPRPYLVFPEDRQHPIRMKDALPLRWIRSGPMHEFHMAADRNEYRAFQIGVFAAKQPLEEVEVRCDKLTSSQGGVLAKPVCFNVDGVDYLGKHFARQVSVPRGRVQSLWFGVDVPSDAIPGEYQGTVTIQPKNTEPTEIKLVLTVTDHQLEDRGDGELWRHSRIRWLNSTVGMDDQPIPPYTPLVVRDNTINSLSCQVQLDSSGLPAQIQCGKQALFSAPMRFVVEEAAGSKALVGNELKLVQQSVGTVAWESENAGKPLAFQCKASMEYDGRLAFRLTCRAAKPIEVQDIRLELPVRREIAPYFMGIGRKGGLRPREWAWKWGGQVYYDSFWTGDVSAGLQCELRGASYCGPMVNLYWSMGQLQPPDSWSNGERGGCKFSESGDTVLFQAYSGPRKLEANQPITFEFALLPTPVKPLDTAGHFRQRYYHSYESVEKISETGANIVNLHHANELNPFINYPFLATEKLRAYVKDAHQRGMKVKLYYTVRELTNHVAEIWFLRSLGHEVLAPGPRAGYPWLREHLIDDYAPAWYDYLPSGDVSAALVTSGASRWLNYYVEGLRWLVENIEIDGLYLDDVSYDRQTLKRIRRVLNGRPGCLIDLHSNTGFSHQPANQYLEFFPYIDQLWFGESFNYDESPDYWLVEISGIPYGLMGEMLQDGGNKWRGMLYGMTARMPWCGDPRMIWELWDDFGIADARMIGYWDPTCPVRTDTPDVLATAYVRPGKTLIALASWAKETAQCRLKLDWNALGLDPAKAVLLAPQIDDFQPAHSFAPNDPIPIEPGRGWLLVVSEQSDS